MPACRGWCRRLASSVHRGTLTCAVSLPRNQSRSSPQDPVAAMHRDHGESSDDATGLPRPLPSAGQKGKRSAGSTGSAQGGYGQESPSSAFGLGRGAGSGSGIYSRQDRHSCGRRGWLAEEDERLKEVGGGGEGEQAVRCL